MKLYKASLGEEILRYLNKTGRIPRKNLYTPFIGYSYRYYARVVQKMIDEDWIRVERYNRKNHIAITEKGKAQLQSAYIDDKKEVDTIQQESAKPRSKKQQKRKKLVADIEGLCVANDFLVTCQEKPSLLEIMRSHDDEAVAAIFHSAVNHGLYYSTTELRKAYIEIIGKNEIANWSRLVGILFFKGHLTFLYSVDKTLIQWMPTNEKRSVDFLLNFLKRSPIITSEIQFEKYPYCIVAGEGMSMIPKLVTGRKWGRTYGSQNTERYRAKFAASHINAHNLAKVFCAAYYAPVAKSGVDMFRLVSMLSDSTRDQIADIWFDKIKTADRIKSMRYQQGVTTNNKHERVVYLPAIDLIELEYLVKQNVPCHIVAPKGTQEAISRVMGPLVLSIRSLDGEKLQYTKYNSYGAPATE